MNFASVFPYFPPCKTSTDSNVCWRFVPYLWMILGQDEDNECEWILVRCTALMSVWRNELSDSFINLIHFTQCTGSGWWWMCLTCLFALNKSIDYWISSRRWIPSFYPFKLMIDAIDPYLCFSHFNLFRQIATFVLISLRNQRNFTIKIVGCIS